MLNPIAIVKALIFTARTNPSNYGGPFMNSFKKPPAAFLILKTGRGQASHQPRPQGYDSRVALEVWHGSGYQTSVGASR